MTMTVFVGTAALGALLLLFILFAYLADRSDRKRK